MLSTLMPHKTKDHVSRETISVMLRSLLSPGSRRVFGDSGVSRETRQDGSTLFQETRRKLIQLLGKQGSAGGW